MGTTDAAWRGRWRDGGGQRGTAELSGDAYYAALGAHVRALQERVEQFVDAHPDLPEQEADRRIRDEIVGPYVLTCTRAAEAAGEPRLPESAVGDIFSRLRRRHGLLASYFDDPSVTDIHIHGPGKPVWVKRAGRVEETPLLLTRDEIMTSIEKWQKGASGALTPLNWSLDVLETRARITALHEHVAVGGPAVSVRLRSVVPLDGPALVERGMMPQAVWDYLSTLFVEAAVSIVVGGRMGSGKTTVMQALLRALPRTCLVVTIERPLELQVGPNVLQLAGHPPVAGDPERTGEVTMRELVHRSLRLDVQRIVVGECRGAEALDMLSAMSLGHDGSITTVHGNTPLEVLNRLALLCLYAPERLSLEAIRATIRDAVGLVVVVGPTSRGLGVTDVAAIEDVTAERFVVVPLLVWDGARLCATGYELPRPLSNRIAARGVDPARLEAHLASLARARPQEVGL